MADTIIEGSATIGWSDNELYLHLTYLPRPSLWRFQLKREVDAMHTSFYSILHSRRRANHSLRGMTGYDYIPNYLRLPVNIDNVIIASLRMV